MKIVNKKPPVYDRAKAVFEIDDAHTIYAYGDTIYNPGNVIIPPQLIAHEETHQRQQGNNPSGWWDRYLVDSAFRYSQELEAYHNEYAFFCKNVSRNREKQTMYLSRIAHILSGPMYNVGKTFIEVMNEVRNYVPRHTTS